jgi:arylsulfatase A
MTLKINRNLIGLIIAFLLAFCVTNLYAADVPARKPNIIFILADDLGIGNVSCYGADNFQTPNIDAFAKTGLRFEHCYAAPLCGPSRALLMTGRYAYHTGMTGNETGSLLKPANEIMMPRVLKPAGYVTAMCGKWSQLPLQPGDWGFDEYLRFNGSGKYWNTQPGAKNYMVNGRRTPLRDGEYLPDKMHEFVMDFITRHKDQPFYVYYAMSHVHLQILPTPDSAPDSKDLYKDNIVYMDKLVGKLLAGLDRLKLRDNTLIVFAGDNGTATPFYLRSTVHGKNLSGHKGTMEECGALVPCIVSWPGKTPADKVSASLINICDFFPTFAAVGGAKLPAGVTIDGRDFAPQLRGESQPWPRDWIFVELGRRWFDRDFDWKLNQASNLFDMRNAPFAEPLVPANTQDAAAIAARKRLQAVLDELNPGGGKLDPGKGSGRLAGANKKRRKAGKNAAAAGPNASQNANAPDQ